MGMVTAATVCILIGVLGVLAARIAYWASDPRPMLRARAEMVRGYAEDADIGYVRHEEDRPVTHTETPFVKRQCPVCKRGVLVLRNGELAHHPVYRMRQTGWCAGSRTV